MTQAVDSIVGTISRTYDGLDELLSEATLPGSISYQYDSAQRRTSMTVAGQPAVNYAWDNANRLTGITQSGTLGTTSVAFGYDNANRRTTLTLPNGILLSYSYDNGSRVTAMSWMNGVTQVGDLEYIYDADGHVVEKTGSLASTGIPSGVSGNTFNPVNEMTAFNGAVLSYDLNGNLLNDGTNTYTWDARNHLSTLTGSGTLPTSASFIYDPLGRRLEKTINQQTTAFLYDGLNPVQELAPSGLGQFAPTAAMLTGLGIDEFFQRMDANGAQSFITDALGSTLALANAAGSVSTSYTYEPFGNVTISPSATNTNPYQFTGRENDGTGLDYYRGRYYSSEEQRFTAQDPIQYAGGDINLYAYVHNAPITNRDELGNGPLAGIAVGAACTAYVVYSHYSNLAELQRLTKEEETLSRRIEQLVRERNGCTDLELEKYIEIQEEIDRLEEQYSKIVERYTQEHFLDSFNDAIKGSLCALATIGAGLSPLP